MQLKGEIMKPTLLAVMLFLQISFSYAASSETLNSRYLQLCKRSKLFKPAIRNAACECTARNMAVKKLPDNEYHLLIRIFRNAASAKSSIRLNEDESIIAEFHEELSLSCEKDPKLELPKETKE
jgi:hypothetical protein